MNYRGEIIVGNDEGIRERYSWGTLNKLLCEETTADENFTFGEIEYDPRSLRGPVIGHEAFHCLRGTGVLRADPVDGISGGSVVVPLGPGTEYYVRGDVPRSIENTGDEPLFGIVFLSPRR